MTHPDGALGLDVADYVWSEDPLFGLMVTNLNALVVDWVARQKVGGVHLGYFVVKQLPVLPPGSYGEMSPWAPVPFGEWLRPYVVELVYTSRDLSTFAAQLGWTGAPFIWDPGRRAVLRAELDAAWFLRYGVERDEVLRILDSFWVVREREQQQFGGFRTKELIVDAYDAMAAASSTAPFVSRLEPLPGNPRAAHLPRSGDRPGEWISWTEVVARTPKPKPSARSIDTSAVTRAPRSMPSPVLSSLFAPDPRAGWQGEATTAPSEIMMGGRVRHHDKGAGTVLSVRQSGRSTDLLIRFDKAGESWIGFGYGVLEFEVQGGE